MDGATRNPLSSATPIEPASGLAPTGFNRAYGEVQRQIRQAWHRVSAYRALTRLERSEGREIEARRWTRYRAETLRDIRMLRETVR